jgi:hypothetical protein
MRGEISRKSKTLDLTPFSANSGVLMKAQANKSSATISMMIVEVSMDLLMIRNVLFGGMLVAKISLAISVLVGF